MFDDSVDDDALALRNHPMGNAALDMLDILNQGYVLAHVHNRMQLICVQKVSLQTMQLNKFWQPRTKDIVDQLYERCYIDRFFLRQDMVLRSGKDAIGEPNISVKELGISTEVLKQHFQTDGALRYVHSFISINEHGRTALQNNRLRLLNLRAKEKAVSEKVRYVIARKKGESSPEIAAGNLYRIIKETRDRYYIDTARVEGVTHSDRSDFIYHDKPGWFVSKEDCFAADVSPEIYQRVLDTIENHWNGLKEQERSINQQIDRLMDIKQQMRADTTQLTTERLQTIVQPVKVEVDEANEFVWTEGDQENEFKL